MRIRIRILGRVMLWGMIWGTTPWNRAITQAASVPPPGITLMEADRAELEAGVNSLRRDLEILKLKWQRQEQLGAAPTLPSRPGLAPQRLLPDVEIYVKAVDWALRYHEIYKTNEIRDARQLLREGAARIRALREGRAPWLTATGLVLRGYRSRLDGSVQPYAMEVPAAPPQLGRLRRLDVWLHGRDNQLTELKFMTQRRRSRGPFPLPDGYVLHPYGRYCNAFKFAGEIDVLEALEHARASYSDVDAQRLGLRGFSMGGAGAWHLAVHHPGLWAAAAPGAGFAETAAYTGILQKQPPPPWHEQVLWGLYDATDYALNLFNLPTIAYSGENDKQMQAALVMAKAMNDQGLDLVHLIGPGTGHAYEPATKQSLAAKFDALMAQGRPVTPSEIRFTTPTLRYAQSFWLRVEGLEAHWHPGTVTARFKDQRVLAVNSKGVTAFSLHFNASLFRGNQPVDVIVNDASFRLPASTSADGSRQATFVHKGERWRRSAAPDGLRKQPGLQGPIDDAFLDRFLFVLPSQSSWNPAQDAWVQQALERATNAWRAQMRGDLPLKYDFEVTPQEMASAHLVMWGTPSSNRLLEKVAPRLPMRWTKNTLKLGHHAYDSADHLPILIYPNPLSPARYVVINSGFTFAEAGPLSNALQTPKLPDWAVVQLPKEPGLHASGEFVLAGFFNEHWQWLPPPAAGLH